MTHYDVRRFPDLEALSRAAADAFAELAQTNGRTCIALSGGTTPRPLYERLAANKSIDWRNVHIFLADERYVPPGDPSSNERLLRETLLTEVDIPGENFHPMYKPGSAEQAAKDYDAALRRCFPARHTFDLAILGVGEDGHTASIFPGVPAPPGEWAYATIGPKPPPQRITVSAECLARSKDVWFLVSGASKEDALRRCLAGENLPAANVADRSDHAKWWVDEAACQDQSSATS